MGNGGDGRGRAAGGKAWGGRFREPTDPAVERLNASIGFDIRLARHDVEGSIAHARMLGRRGIIPPADARAIERGLRQVAREVETGRFQPTVGDEDVHMAIERRLVELIGPAGKRLHTGRSRNDQVALDTRLYLREASGEIRAQVHALIRCLLTAAERHASVLMPAYTHLQPAQPVLFAHHLCAYGEMLARDLARLRDAAGRADEMALGSGACTGTTFPLDREAVRRALGFARLTRNSLDAVADRDFILEFEAAAAILMMHLSRLAEELILWSSREFGFVEFSDAVTTGSSMMPQKRNLDGAELVRGKAGRVFGRLLALLTTMKGLPLAYNKDLQEDKEGLFDVVDTLRLCLPAMGRMIETMRVNAAAMRRALDDPAGYVCATELADYLTRRGMPFRDAHHAAGRIVARAADLGVGLADLPLEEMRRIEPSIGPDLPPLLTPEAAVAGRDLFGGTAPRRVKAAIRAIRRESDRLLD